ncbi:hypothetical protein AB0E85_39215, partial [Streptomyces sp. NPDC029044]|uniref:hypothetical protein n=1 Tax=Streptomyces sp. NPDC029044 TaxID=3157198 RepID=UPI0034095EF5
MSSLITTVNPATGQPLATYEASGFVSGHLAMIEEPEAIAGTAAFASGGRFVVRPDRAADHLAEYSVIAGNTIGYGAT